MTHPWVEQFPAAITVCDRQGIIIEMNTKSQQIFSEEGGATLIGSSLIDCHNPNSQAMIQNMLDTDTSNVYTIEKKGKHKFIYQAPWFEDGECQGLVEMSFEIPAEMPHFIRS